MRRSARRSRASRATRRPRARAGPEPRPPDEPLSPDGPAAGRRADRLRRRQDRRRGHPHPRAPVRHRPDRGGPRDPARRPDLGAARRDHAPVGRRAAPLGRHRPPEHARDVRPGQRGRCWPTRPSSSSATAGTGSIAPQADADATADFVAEAPNTGETRGWDDGAEPVPPAGPDRAARQRDRQPASSWSSPSTGSAPTRRARSAGPTTRSASRGTSGSSAARRAAGTPSTTRPRTASGCGCRRSWSSRWSSSRSASSGSGSRSSDGDGGVRSRRDVAEREVLALCFSALCFPRSARRS